MHAEILTSYGNGDTKMTDVARKKLFGRGATADRREAGSPFVFDPTTGALIVRPDLDLKIRKAIMREAGRSTHRLDLAQARLYPELLWLKCNSALLEIVCDLRSQFRKRSTHRHRIPL
jgi:hypothetical protein